jgi:2-(1,2-epoxy-1,2-dihydrophenyl)acetyl-CoA isomerase
VSDAGGVTGDRRVVGSASAREDGMGYETIELERSGPVTTVTLNRPAARNALDLVMRRELLGALDDLEADPETRVVVLTGAGGHFCSGGDVKSMRETRHTAAMGRARVEALNRLVLRLVEFPRPTIAMVDGFAVGAGCNLALCCDLVVASDRARFGEVFRQIGLVPDGGGTWLLSRAVGLARAKELIFTADVVDAAEAARIGLVNRVVPAAELRATTRALAERIAAGPPAALRLAKHLVNRGATSDLAAALDLEAFAQGQALASEDHQEGLRAFFEKRPPRFSGR